ncbi:MFS transporter [Oligoflexaceae bacterium]|nr:MFS transporter [Oligoflexaceae bacterium]
MQKFLEDSSGHRNRFFFLIYLFQGIPGGYLLVGLTLHLTSQGVSAVNIGTLAGVSSIPWMFKWLAGPYFDRRVAKGSGRRMRPIRCLSGLILCNALLLFSIAQPELQIAWLTTLFLVHAAFAASLDVVVDGLAVEVIPEVERGRTSAFMMSGRFVGSAIGSALLGSVLIRIGYFESVVVYLLLLLTVYLLVCSFREQTSANRVRHSFTGVLRVSLIKIFTKRSLLALAIVCLVDVGISFARRVLDFQFIATGGWDPLHLSIVKGVGGAVIAIGALGIIGRMTDKKGPVRVTALVSLFFMVTYVGMIALAEHWGSAWLGFSYSALDLALRPAFQCASMPIFMALCSKEVEGTQFAIYSSIFNFADISGAFLFAHLFERVGDVVSLTICVVLIAIAIILLRVLQKMTTPAAEA